MLPSYDASELPRLVYINESKPCYKAHYNCALNPRTNEAPRLAGKDGARTALSEHNVDGDGKLEDKRYDESVKTQGDDVTDKSHTTNLQKTTQDSKTAGP